MKKKYAALLVAAAIMAVPGTLAMAAGSPNTNATVSHGGGHNSSASSKSAGHHVSGAEYDKTIEYDGIRQKVVPTIERKGARDIIGSTKKNYDN